MLFQRKKILVTNPRPGTASVSASTLCPFGQGGTCLADVLALAGCRGPASSPPGLRECAMRVIGPLGMGGRRVWKLLKSPTWGGGEDRTIPSAVIGSGPFLLFMTGEGGTAPGLRDQ